MEAGQITIIKCLIKHFISLRPLGRNIVLFILYTMAETKWNYGLNVECAILNFMKYGVLMTEIQLQWMFMELLLNYFVLLINF